MHILDALFPIYYADVNTPLAKGTTLIDVVEDGKEDTMADIDWFTTIKCRQTLLNFN